MIFSSKIFEEFLSLSLVNSLSIQFRITLLSTSAIVVDWGDGVIESYSGTTITIVKNYSSAYTGVIKIRCADGNRLITVLDSFDFTNTTQNSIAFTIDQLLAFKGLKTFDISTSINTVMTGDITPLGTSSINKFVVNTGNNLSGNITNFTAFTYLSIFGTNTITGNISGLTNLTYLDIRGSNTCFGDVTSLTSLTRLILLSTNDTMVINGSITGMTSLNRVQLGSLNMPSSNVTVTGDITLLTALTRAEFRGNTNISGSIANLTELTNFIAVSSVTVTGSISLLTKLIQLEVRGTNTLEGSINGLTLLQQLILTGNNTVTGSTTSINGLQKIELGGSNTIRTTIVTSQTLLSYLLNTNQTFSTSEVNTILAGVLANSGIAKPSTARVIDLRGTISSGPPTGQGITDKNTLLSTITPPGTITWSVITR
jgi:hypothetical protein